METIFAVVGRRIVGVVHRDFGVKTLVDKRAVKGDEITHHNCFKMLLVVVLLLEIFK